MSDAEKPVVETEKKIPNFVIEARMKDYVKAAEVHSTGDLIDELNKMVAEILDKAIRRCKQNSRSTVQPKDL
jgi:histone H3/H4